MEPTLFCVRRRWWSALFTVAAALVSMAAFGVGRADAAIGPAFALVHSASGGSVNSTSSVAGTVTFTAATAGDLLVGCVGGSDTSTAALGESTSGWSTLGAAVTNSSGQLYGECWYRVSVGGETTLAFTWTGTLTGTTSVDEYSGFVGTPAVDLTANANSGATSSGAVASVQAGVVQASQDELVGALTVYSTTGTLSVGSFGHGANLCTLATTGTPSSNQARSTSCESTAQDATAPTWSVTQSAAAKWLIDGFTFSDTAVNTSGTDSADTALSSTSTQITNYGKDAVALGLSVMALSIGIGLLVQWAKKGAERAG